MRSIKLLFALLLAQSCWGALLGHLAWTSAANGGTLSYTIAQSGSLLVVYGEISDASETLNITSDTKANSWACVTTTSSNINGNAIGQRYCYATTNASGADTITVFTSIGDTAVWEVMEFSNAVSSTPWDTNSANGNTTGTAMTSGSFTTTHTDTIISCGVNFGNISMTKDAAFTLIDSTTGRLCQYATGKVAGAYNPAITSGGSGAWAEQGVSFQESGGSSNSVTPAHSGTF